MSVDANTDNTYVMPGQERAAAPFVGRRGGSVRLGTAVSSSEESSANAVFRNVRQAGHLMFIIRQETTNCPQNVAVSCTREVEESTAALQHEYAVPRKLNLAICTDTFTSFCRGSVIPQYQRRHETFQ